MIASLFMVGFEVADVTITDILSKRNLSLEVFRGLVFPGGFSYADVLGSARGWAATMKYNDTIEQQLKRFKSKDNTFSLGVCNGCQLMALLGWVGSQTDGNSLYNDFFKKIRISIKSYVYYINRKSGNTFRT